MAKTPVIKHIKSAVKDKAPQPGQLEYGQIAVNYNNENPFLAIKDSNDDVVKFLCEDAIEYSISGMVETILPEVVGNNYYTKAEVDTQIADAKLLRKQIVQELPDVQNADINTIYYVPIEPAESGTTNVYYEYTIIDGNFEQMGTTDVDLDGYATEQWVIDQNYLKEHQSLDNYYSKSQVDGKIDTLSAATDTKLEEKADKSEIPSLDGYATETWVQEQGYLTEHQSLENYYTKSEVDNEISGATDGLASEQWVQEQGYLTQHQSLDNYYTKSQVDDALSGETEDVKTWVGEQGYLTEHQSLANYYTKDQTSGATEISQALALKADITSIPDVSDYFDDAQYDSNTKRINFYHGDVVKAYIDASPFIVDGMIEDVRIETLSGTTYLVIDFNSESGQQDILIPITDIFNAANYYTKAETDSAISGATQDMATMTWVTSQGYLTQHQSLDNYYNKSQVDDAISGATTDMATMTWVGQQGYLTQHQSLADYYTKEQTSGATEISEALSLKADKTEIPSLTGYATETYVTNAVNALSGATDTKLEGKVDNADFLALSGSVMTALADKEKKAWMGTQEQYAAISGSTESDRLYLITDGNTTVNLSGYYSKSQVDALLQALDTRITALETE